MQEIYSQVQALLKSHKGYVRQSEKKNVFIKLVQLKKEFKLANQDFNEFYITHNNNNNQLKWDFELVDQIEELKKLFENKRPTKRNCGSLFDEMDLSIVIPTEADEKLDKIDFKEISEKDFEQSQDQIEQFTDQITDCSPANSSTRRRTTNLIKRATKQYTIQPIQIQSEITQQSEIIKRKSSIKSINSPLTPKTPDSPSTITSRNNQFNAQQILQQKLKLPATPPKKQDQQYFQEDQNSIIKKEIYKRQSKLISRKTTLDLQEEPNQKPRLNSRNSLGEVTEHSENEHKVIENFATNQSQITIESKEEINNIQSILDQVEHLNDQLPILTNENIQVLSNNSQQLLQNKTYQDLQEFKIIQELYESTNIYDADILNKHRKNKFRNQWNQDIQSILTNQNQFF